MQRLSATLSAFESGYQTDDTSPGIAPVVEKSASHRYVFIDVVGHNNGGNMRYLTVEEKQLQLRQLEMLYSNANPLPDNGLDSPLVPYLKRLNALDGVCTIESCAGHRLDDGYIKNALLWIRLSERNARQFVARVSNLVRLSDYGIETVSIEYRPWGGIQEFVEIVWQGMAYGDTRFHGCAELITCFFEDIVQEAKDG